MKNIMILFLAAFFITACSGGSNQDPDQSTADSTSTEDPKMTSDLNLTDSIPTIHSDYEEFYKSGSLKIEGNFDDNEARNGLWVSYYEDGIKWSESFYVHGKKEGHSITFFPNGKVRYVGEYKDDVKTGLWRFYNESGELEKEETF